MKLPEKTIEELIALKRADGYDAEFEATLSKIWLCPHCQRRATMLELIIPVGTDKDLLCPRCMCEGITPLEIGDPKLVIVAGGKS